LKTRDKRLVHRFRLAMLVNGVDLMGWPGGMVSATHGPKEMDATVEAFAASLAMLRRDGEL
jgi:glutamate-1-semialdehyde 2,1-aminomutase